MICSEPTNFEALQRAAVHAAGRAQFTLGVAGGLLDAWRVLQMRIMRAEDTTLQAIGDTFGFDRAKVHRVLTGKSEPDANRLADQLVREAIAELSNSKPVD